MNLFGWDVLFACSLDRINDHVSQNGPDVSFDFTDSKTGNHMTGTFGPWQVGYDGSVGELKVATPITSGNFTCGGTTIDLTGVVPELGVSLSFIDDVSTANVKDLKFDLTGEAGGGGENSSSPVICKATDTGTALQTADSSGVTAGALKEILPACVMANKDKLASVLFASLNTLPTGDLAWMIPKVFGYGMSPTHLIIKVRTLDGTPGQDNIDDTLVTGDRDLIYAISRDVFLQNVVLPKLRAGFRFEGGMLIYDGTPVDATLDDMPITIHVTRMQIDLKDILFTVTIDGNFSVDAGGGASMGVTFHFANSSILAVTTGDYGNSIQFQPNPNGDPKPSFTPDNPDFLTKLNEFLDDDLQAKFAATVARIQDSVTDGFSEGLLENLCPALVEAVAFPGVSGFDADQGGLSDLIYFRGSISSGGGDSGIQ